MRLFPESALSVHSAGGAAQLAAPPRLWEFGKENCKKSPEGTPSQAGPEGARVRPLRGGWKLTPAGRSEAFFDVKVLTEKAAQPKGQRSADVT